MATSASELVKWLDDSDRRLCINNGYKKPIKLHLNSDTHPTDITKNKCLPKIESKHSYYFGNYSHVQKST
jgi:hypothetical protein